MTMMATVMAGLRLPHRRLLMLLLLLSLNPTRLEGGGSSSSSSEEQTCEIAGVCEQAAVNTDAPLERCAVPTWLYQQGGTAQAYKPLQPDKQQLCDDNASYAVATWPYWRSRKKTPPRLNVQLSVWSCQDSTVTATATKPSSIMWRKSSSPVPSVADRQCHCTHMANTTSSATVVVDVWQARPNGIYSSLRAGVDDGDCRASIKLQEGSSIISFTTYAPGSTGILGGLGPAGLDFAPYGPPVLHLLVHAAEHATTLVDVPVLLHRTLLQQVEFWGRDWRGPAWVRGDGGAVRQQRTASYEITTWTPHIKNNAVDIHLNIFVPRIINDRKKAKATATAPRLCHALLPGWPSAFFLEPLAVCASSILDFFAL